MKKEVIFFFMFFILSFNVIADSFNLRASVQEKEVTLTWNNIFYESCNKGEKKCEEMNVMACENNQWNMVESCTYQCEDGQCIIKEVSEDGGTAPNEGSSISGIDNNELITTGATVNVKKGFFSRIFYSIVNTFRKVFGLSPVGISVGEKGYIIYKHVETSESEQISGSLSDFNCNEQCSYSYTEETDGTYTYSVASTVNNKVEENSEISIPIEIVIEPSEPEGAAEEPGCTTNEDCDEGYNCVENTCIAFECDENNPCEEGYNCIENECVVIELECDENNPCPDENKECNIETHTCVDIAQEINCDSQGNCLEGYTCNIETNICIEEETPLAAPQQNTCEAGDTETQECNFDVGICQKPGIKTRTCTEDGIWGEFSQCDIPEEEKCNSEEDCESGLCYLDLNSCLPVEFEDSEITCDDELDNDCDELSDCDDEDCGCEPQDNGGSGGNAPSDNIPEEQELAGDTFTVESEGKNAPARDVVGRIEQDEYETQYQERKGMSILTWIVIFFVLLVVGVAALYLYLFKFRKYKKEDIIAWVEYSRNLISKGYDSSHVRKKLEESNLPKDFVKIVMKKLK